MIKQDLHVHLYGCLSAKDLWDIGKDRYKKQHEMLCWYASEYKKAWGYTPKFSEYWEKDSGFESLQSDYHFIKPNNFEKFQANFNLIISLCPIRPDDFSVQEMIIRNVDNAGLEYFEARTVIPHKFSGLDIENYLTGLCKTVRNLNSELKMKTRIAFSLFRDNHLAEESYNQLRSFLRAYPELGSVISGIDFAFAEEGWPPKTKKNLFNRFHLDNQKERPLDLLYHVGESFEDKGIVSAIRWVWEAQHLGATRLGHAIALGVSPENYFGKIIYEPKDERLDTIQWLRLNSGLLKDFGYEVNLKKLTAEEDAIKRHSPKNIKIIYDDTYIEDAKNLQHAVAAILKSKKVIIETCPSSNLRIGQVKTNAYHPLGLFHRMGLNYVTCTDDPGIFAIDWNSEYKLAEDIIQATKA